ncbi:hypothetical protein ACQP2Y_46815 (plasmid) [Actinoplanes sp. CA-051413]|uniref:hypothetical protein n=1 Tax=Actinoplanes sp. CA-051413 TaxID=3239899 RepID=UPI003D966923
MTIDDPTSKPSSEEFRETFDLVDRVVDQVEDQHIEEQLTKLLENAGMDVSASMSGAAWGELDGLPDFEMPFSAAMRLEEVACQLREAEAKLAAAEAAVEAAQTRAIVEMRQANYAARFAARHREKAAAAVESMDAYVNTALGRAQEILDKAHEDARKILEAAEKRATETQAEAERATRATAPTTNWHSALSYAIKHLIDHADAPTAREVLEALATYDSATPARNTADTETSDHQRRPNLEDWGRAYLGHLKRANLPAQPSGQGQLALYCAGLYQPRHLVPDEEHNASQVSNLLILGHGLNQYWRAESASEPEPVYLQLVAERCSESSSKTSSQSAGPPEDDEPPEDARCATAGHGVSD